MYLNLKKQDNNFVLDIAYNRIFIHSNELSNKNGIIIDSDNSLITYDDNSITLNCNAFSTTFNVGSESIKKLKEKMSKISNINCHTKKLNILNS